MTEVSAPFDFDALNKALDVFWDGFLSELREGRFDQSKYDQLLALLRSLPRNVDSFPKRTVAMLWTIPYFMSLQTERVCDKSGVSRSDYISCYSATYDCIEHFLGAP